jgi:hypothetical protein
VAKTPLPFPLPIYSRGEKEQSNVCGADLSDIDEEKSDIDEGDLKKRKTDLARAQTGNGAKRS